MSASFPLSAHCLHDLRSPPRSGSSSRPYSAPVRDLCRFRRPVPAALFYTRRCARPAHQSVFHPRADSTRLDVPRPTPAALADAERIVRKAFAQGYIQIVTPGSQLSPSSLEIKWEEELKALIRGARTCGLDAFASPVSPQMLTVSTRRRPLSSVPLPAPRPAGIPTTKDLKAVKDKLREKQASWAEEEQLRAKGKVRSRLRESFRLSLAASPTDAT